MDNPLDAQVRRVDEDRWLASRFAPKPTRAPLIALYALNYEIARTAEAVTQEGLGDIRLAWWREALDEIYAERPPRAHPALEAYAVAVRAKQLPRAPLDAMIDARAKDLETAPFEGWPDLDAYVEATAGAVLQLALDICAETPERPKQLDSFIRNAAKAWGYAGLLRALPHWTARGRTFFPHKLLAHNGLDPSTLFTDYTGHPARSCMAAVLDRGRSAFKEARELATLLPSAMFPAFGYLTFAPRYYKALGTATYEVTPDLQLAPLLVRQLALVAASATGKV